MGVTANELMIGSPPFGGSPVEVWRQRAANPLPTGIFIGAGVRPARCEVLEQAAHKNATYRYKTAEHYFHALETACT